MIRVNIFEAKARLSELVAKAVAGEKVVICKRNQPLAELHPLSTTQTKPRPVGLARGQVEIPDSFFEPLADEDLRGFTDPVVFPA